jgi:hypothetical protein
LVNITNTLSAAGDTRLLILDGHSSHISIDFLIYAVEHNIAVLCLPSHTSHILQPLDVGLFATLQQHYSDELDRWTSKGLFRVNKAEFFKYSSYLNSILYWAIIAN